MQGVLNLPLAITTHMLSLKKSTFLYAMNTTRILLPIGSPRQHLTSERVVRTPGRLLDGQFSFLG